MRAVLKKYAARDGQQQVAMRVTIARETRYMNVDVRVPAAAWDDAKGRITRKHPDADNLNTIIMAEVGRVSSIITRMRVSGRKPTIEAFMIEYGKPGSTGNFIQFCRQHLEKLRDNATIAHGTYQKYRRAIDLVEMYSPALTFNTLSSRWLEDYEKWLRDKMSREGASRHKTGEAGVNNAMRAIRFFVHRARDMGVEVDNPFVGYKIPKPHSTRQCLSKDEVSRMRWLYTQEMHPTHREVLAAFLMCCYTGLRTGDVIRLRYDQIMDGMIHLAPYKTRRLGIEILVPVSDMVKGLLDWKDAPGKVFKLPSSQKMNKYIKELARRVEIEKNIVFTTGRHSFATLMLESGAPPSIVMVMLGHRDIKTTMQYIHHHSTQLKQYIDYLNVQGSELQRRR